MNNLPPGCTNDDIDRAFGGVITCVECGRQFTFRSEHEGHEDNWVCVRCARTGRDE